MSGLSPRSELHDLLELLESLEFFELRDVWGLNSRWARVPDFGS